MYKIFSAILVCLVVLAGCGKSAGTNPPVSGQPGANLTPRPTVAAGSNQGIPPATATTIAPTPTSGSPTAAPQPTTIPPTVAAPTAAPQTERKLVFSDPAAGAIIDSPLRISGNATVMPFEGNLIVELLDGAGTLLRKTAITAQGELGGPAIWSAEIEFSPPASDQPGTIVIYETSAKDGTVVVKATLPVQLRGSGNTDAPAEQTITINPPAGDALASPFQISGSATFTPFEKTFGAAVYDSEGNLIGQAGIQAEGEYGGPSTFSGEIEFTAPVTARPGKIVVYEASAKDGSIVAQDSLAVRLAAYDGSGEHIALPAHNASVTLPLHIEAGGADSYTSYALRLVYDDGTVLEGGVSTPKTTTGVTNLAANLDWATESAPPPGGSPPPSQHARLELSDRIGNVLATRDVYVLNHDDQALMPLKVYFTLGEQLQEVTRYVPRTEAVATAALRELSWGPAGNELAAAGMDSALPRPEILVDWPFFQDDWASRVYLQSISISEGTARVDWSREMAAWGGGSARLSLLNQQINATLGQFPTVRQVVITVDGSTEVLQP